MNKNILSVLLLTSTLFGLTASAQFGLTASAQFGGGRPGMGRPSDRRGDGRGDGSMRNRPAPVPYPNSTPIEASPLIPWIQNVNNISLNLLQTSQQVTLSQSDYAIAMQKLGQAQQLLIEVSNLMRDMVPVGVCAMIYEENNYSGQGYEILPTIAGDFASEYRYYSFSHFPIFTSGRSYPGSTNLNDRISSVAVKRGCTVSLHEHDGFQGFAHSYNTNAPSLIADNQYSSATCYCPPGTY